MAEAEKTEQRHIWRFFRAGGFDQVRIDRGSDAAALATLDQKLWVALACPTRGVEFDERTFDLIDTDKDGRIRAPDMIDAVAWTTSLLKDPDSLARETDTLALDAIDDAAPLGHDIRASAEAILAMLHKAGATQISLQDALDIEAIFDGTPFNGDGIITTASAEDDATRAVLVEIMDCLGTETDRSRLPGVSQAIVDRFFAEAADFCAWHREATAAVDRLLPLGDATDDAAALVAALAPKLDDFFARVALAAFDPRAADALNPPVASYEAFAGETLASDGAEIAALPLGHVEAGQKLPLGAGVNPAWAERVARFGATVVTPLLGARDALSAADWETLKLRFAPHAEWIARKPETAVAKLGLDRLEALLDPAIKARIDALIARDKALEPQMNAISQVEKLVRLKRDLLPLLNNFVSFKDFYTRTGKAMFQAGTLYLDARSCDLCIKVEDEAKHAQLATLSRIYLAYCKCTRSGGKEAMTIAAAFTAGDADNLLVGRNGVFYDRKGRDWDATIIKIVEHPISLREAFWLPYRQAARFMGDQVQKFAAARSAASQTQLTQTIARSETQIAAPAAAPAAAAPGTPPAATAQQQAFDAARFAGIFAAIGLAIGAIGTAIASLVTGFLRLTWWQMPLAILGIILIVSGPSCVIAFLKLRSRNLGPLLDASGWAVNTRLRINLPFGRTLTSLAQLPPDAERSLSDPYAERKQPWVWYLVLILVLVAAYVVWHQHARWWH
ncbi:MAG TPA: hypothetical protein VL993_16915 [Stellaceae bacterium]|nr:hypothetical protein [Stellaceae bacterium]